MGRAQGLGGKSCGALRGIRSVTSSLLQPAAAAAAGIGQWLIWSANMYIKDQVKVSFASRG